MRFVLPMLAIAASFASPAAAQLTAPEQAIVETVESGFERDAALLEQITLINSGTHNHAGVKAVADVLVPEFEALGTRTPSRPQTEEPPTAKRAP